MYIYIIPNTNTMGLNTTHASVVEQLRIVHRLVYLVGDYNINLFDSETHDSTDSSVDAMYIQ